VHEDPRGGVWLSLKVLFKEERGTHLFRLTGGKATMNSPNSDNKESLLRWLYYPITTVVVAAERQMM
jgi:hypothetical protein